MFSFRSLAIFSAFALGAVTAVVAAPLESETSLLVRQCACSGAASIISGLSDDLASPISELQYITAENCTVDALQPIVGDITARITVAIGEVHALVGQSAAVILASVDGSVQISVGELAAIVADLLVVVFTALGLVLNIAASASITVVLPLLATVGATLGALVSVLIAVVGSVAGGLAVSILALIGSVIEIILHLNVSVLISAVGIVSL